MDWQKVADRRGRDTALDAKDTAPRHKHWIFTLKASRPLFTDPSSPSNSFNASSFLRRTDQSEVKRGDPNQSEVVFFFWLYGPGRELIHYTPGAVTTDRRSCSSIFSNRSSMLDSHSGSVSMNLGSPVSSELTRGNPRCNTDNPRRNAGNSNLPSGAGSPPSCPLHGRICRTVAVICRNLHLVALRPLWLQWIFFGGSICSSANRTSATQLQLFAGRRCILPWTGWNYPVHPGQFARTKTRRG